VFFYSLFSIVAFNLNQIIKLTDFIGKLTARVSDSSYFFQNTIVLRYSVGSHSNVIQS